MNYLIDINIISEVGRGDRCNANVAACYASIKDVGNTIWRMTVSPHEHGQM